MKLSRTLLALVALCTLVTAGCDESITDPNASKTTLLTKQTWKTVTYTVGGVDQTATKPKLSKFNADGSILVTNPDNSTDTGTWSFNVDETNLVIDGLNWEILALTASSLNLKLTGPPEVRFSMVPE